MKIRRFNENVDNEIEVDFYKDLKRDDILLQLHSILPSFEKTEESIINDKFFDEQVIAPTVYDERIILLLGKSPGDDKAYAWEIDLKNAPMKFGVFYYNSESIEPWFEYNSNGTKVNQHFLDGRNFGI
jgi:hypothetical protein